MCRIGVFLVSVFGIVACGYCGEVGESSSGTGAAIAGQPAIVLDRIMVTTGGAAVNVTEGWAFTLDQDLWVVSLGVWDSKRDGLREEHPVAIWDERGTLILKSSVPAGDKSFLVNDFRYTRVLPSRLKRGETYIVGAFYSKPLVDPHVDGGSNNRISQHKHIRWMGRRRLIADKLTFPADKADSNVGAFGPNLLVEGGVMPTVPQRQ